MSVFILGISAFYHDSAAVLIRDGEIIAAAQEERFTRKKHDPSFPKQAISYCLEKFSIDIDQLNHIVFYDKPLIKFERLLETYLSYAPCGVRSFISAMPIWVKEKLFLKDLIIKELKSLSKKSLPKNYRLNILFTEHHESHAASAFFPSPFEEAAIITMDGVGEWATTSYGVGWGNNIELISEIHFPHSLGLLYSAFTHYTGFKVNSAEYKVMGLAPYGEPKYVKTIFDNLIDLKEDGSFRLNMDYFNYCTGLSMTNKKFHKLFGGQPRNPNEPLEKKHMDLARSIQVITEEVVMGIAKNVYSQTGKENLCLAGGVALNCVSNGRLLREGPFKNIWVQPAAGDAGGALGAALDVWYRYLGNERNISTAEDSMKGAYLGPSFDNKRIENFLLEKNILHKQLDTENLVKEVANLIEEGKIIGWFQGSMEFGPRALGSRSIIADARKGNMQSEINLKIKYRESFRPFAPSLLEEDRKEYFEANQPSPYMLFVDLVKEKHRIHQQENNVSLSLKEIINTPRSDIPAVTHVDYSARFHTVNDKQNKLFYRLLKAVKAKTGCSVIINTSFNVRSEPIVCTPEDAYRCFMRTELDYLVMGNFVVDKLKQNKSSGNDYCREKQFKTN